jgi:signal peptidase I
MGLLQKKTVEVPIGGGVSESRPRRIPINKNVLVWIRDILIALAIALVIMQFIRPTIVREHSMENTLHENDYIFLNKQAYRFGDVHRRDIVVVHSLLESADGTSKNLIKRVIGLPGDRVAIRDGGVYVNGNRLDEPYTLDGYTEGEMEEVVVPDGMLFLLGDNRQGSADSRDPRIGFVPEEMIIGKAIFRLFPIGDVGTL